VHERLVLTGARPRGKEKKEKKGVKPQLAHWIDNKKKKEEESIGDPVHQAALSCVCSVTLVRGGRGGGKKKKKRGEKREGKSRAPVRTRRKKKRVGRR